MVMKIKKKVKCEHCSVFYYSRFCISLHSHVHKCQLNRTAELQCIVCTKGFSDTRIFQNHQTHHGLKWLEQNYASEQSTTFGKLRNCFYVFHIIVIVKVRITSPDIVYQLCLDSPDDSENLQKGFLNQS